MVAPRPFRLAHLSDLHIGPLPRIALRQLLSKRLLGYLSWRTRKQRIHRMEVLAALRHDLQASAPDHVVITGDLVNLGLPAEFARAGAWLRDLGTPEWISVIPGNHDAYVRVGAGESWELWADYMRSDEPSPTGSAFPYLRRRGPLAIIGLSSAIVTPLGLATGRLGAPQLEALDRVLANLADRDRCRVVLLHHPPYAGASGWRKRLIDAAAFRAIVARRGADLILCGHAVRFRCLAYLRHRASMPALVARLNIRSMRSRGLEQNGSSAAKLALTTAPARAFWSFPSEHFGPRPSLMPSHAEDRRRQQP
jgi:3',5'-cyclic AMP phosphodiesterase CpdA